MVELGFVVRRCALRISQCFLCVVVLSAFTSASLAQSTASPAANTPATQPQSAQNPPATLRTLPHATPGEAATQGQSSAGAPSVASAPGAAGSQEGEYSIRTSVNEVDLIFAVVDKHGHFVNNLTENDFALLDNRMPPEEVYSFKQQTNLPLRVGLLIDASNSIRSRFQFEQEAATEFLLDILRPQVDKAFVMGFDVVPDVTQGFTNNGDLLATGIHKLEPGGGTALYDAVYTACRDKLLPMHGTTALRKAIILVSDGDDNQSHTDLDDAIKMCQRADTIIYAVSTNNSPSRDRGDDVLKAMAEATGGRAIYPIDMEHVADAFRAIQDELRSQYSLVYKPADFKANDSFRPIYLVTMDRRYKVRVSKGYFAQK